MPDFIKIHPKDNVAVALHPMARGTVFAGVTAVEDIPQGHKMALVPGLLKKHSKAIYS